MGLIQQMLVALFGSGRNVVAETAEVFRVNAEAASKRGHDLDGAALSQLAAEFVAHQSRGWFDILMDGVNRLPRPVMVFGVIWTLVATARDPEGMSQVFNALATIPEPVWVIIGIIVTFYFGGRAQAKDLDFRKGMASAAAVVGSKPPARDAGDLDEDQKDINPALKDAGF